MVIIMTLFYGFFGLVLLFFLFQYAIRSGIDSSRQIKALRAELTEIKKQLRDNKTD